MSDTPAMARARDDLSRLTPRSWLAETLALLLAEAEERESKLATAEADTADTTAAVAELWMRVDIAEAEAAKWRGLAAQAVAAHAVPRGQYQRAAAKRKRDAAHEAIKAALAAGGEK